MTAQRYLGFFGDGGIGLGLSLAAGVSGTVLGTVTFLSDQSLTFDDFANANFRIACIRGPSASMGNFVSFAGSTSKIVDFSLSNGVVLTSTETKSFSFTPPKVPGLEDLTDPKKFVRKWTQAKLDGKIFELSLGFGHFFLSRGTGQPEKPSLPDPSTRGPASFSKRWIEALFPVDSAEINAVAPDGTTPRYVFEILLAIERAMFETADARVRSLGYASPEQTAAYNLALSQARADAVVQALRDAFGTTLSIKDPKSIAMGEAPAENAGLHDPESLQLTIPQFTAQYPSEVAEWPQWRRVDLDIEGTLVASAGGG